MIAHPVTWLAPRPLWPGLTAPAGLKPAILRFASDDFMEELIGVLADDPARIGERIAAPETWRDGPGAHRATPRPPELPLPGNLRRFRLGRRLAAPLAPLPARPAATKLYQPAHGRYYVVAASLACAIPGLPERRFSPGGPEAAGFVLRRFLPAEEDGEALAEFAWTQGEDGGRWQRVAPDGECPARLSPGEEMLPVFPLPHGDAEGRRTLWGGLVPVGRREEYMAAPVERTPLALAEGQALALRGRVPEVPPEPGIALRLTKFSSDVIEPWMSLVRSAFFDAANIAASTDETVAERQGRTTGLNVGWAGQSWLILLDFARFLEGHLPAVMSALGGGAMPARAEEAALVTELNAVTLPGALAASMVPGKLFLASLGQALAEIGQYGAALEASEENYALGHQDAAGLPPWHFPLAAVDGAFALSGAARHYVDLPDMPDFGGGIEAPPEAPGSATHEQAMAAGMKLTLLAGKVAAALQPADESLEEPMPFAAITRDAMEQSAGDAGSFVLRFVYLNADCGPIHPPVVSEATDPFQLAHFFDFDAPARPVRITLPLDTSAAALRKYPRNTAFVMSDILCGQVQRAKGLGLVDLIRHVLPFPLHKELDLGDGGGCKSGGSEIGMICSLSIPIITICALILLMIIVTLLDFIFKWLPYFVTCFPLRGFKGKPS